ncbi:endo-1,4-beta-xylanase [Larkinella ripae]
MKNAKANKMYFEQFDAKTVHAYMNTEPSRGQFNFKELDYWVKQNQSQSLRLHGHSLVYHIAAPEWFNQLKTTNEFEGAVKNHIQTVVSRYKGQVKSWDVINEIFDIYDKTATNNIRRTSFRLKYASDDAYLAFVKRCFQWAHEADPNAVLFYNDFDLENSQVKLNAFLRFAADCKRSGVPLHGIGTQSHININTSDASIRATLKALASTGLQVHISELDIKMNPANDTQLTFSNDLLNKQRAKFQQVATAYKQLVPPSQQFGITVWDLGDTDSWVVNQQKQNDLPTLFDKQYNKKPAFFGLLEGLR